jgi:putative acetyltransferase
MVLIRSEIEGDKHSIERVLLSAFDIPDEARAVYLLRKASAVSFSLVAEMDGDIVAHILFSPIELEPLQPGFSALELAPLAVLPEFQNKEIGSQLVSAGLQDCCRMGFSAVFVLGNPGYYARFGSCPDSEYSLSSVYDAGDAFLALELQSVSLAVFSGVVYYRPEFNLAGV